MHRPLAFVALAILAAAARAQTTHHVPQDHETIQEAVDAAADDDTILISAGTYEEAVLVANKTNLTLRGKGKVILAPPGGAALTLDDCGDCVIEKLRVEGGDVGFQLIDTHDTLLSKCRVEGTVGDGIRLEAGNDNRVDKCVITDAGGNGIVVANIGTTPHDHDITRCKVIGAGQDGILAIGEFIRVDKCLIDGPGGRGLAADDVFVCKNGTFSRCKVLDAQSDGIAVTGNEMSVTQCKVLGGTNIGIVDLGGFLDVISACKVVKAGTVGIACDPLTVEVTVQDCKVTAAAGDGVADTGSGNVLEGNKVSKAGEDGIDVSGGGCSLTANKVSASVQDGIRLSVGADHCTLIGNKAHGSGGFDFDDVAADPSNLVDDTNKFGTTGP